MLSFASCMCNTVFYLLKLIVKNYIIGISLLWTSLVVEDPPSKAGEGVAVSITGRGTQIPHAGWQLSLVAATTEPKHSRACAPLGGKPSHSNKDPAH